MCAPVSSDSGMDSTHGERYTPPAMRLRAATMSASVTMGSTLARVRLERQLNAWLGVTQHAPEFALDALHRLGRIGLEAQHDHGCRVRSAREAEPVRIFHAQAIDANDIRG